MKIQNPIIGAALEALERASRGSIRRSLRARQRTRAARRAAAPPLSALWPAVLALALALAVVIMPSKAWAGWVGERIDLMGTSVSVELWLDDETRGRELVEQVLDDYRRIDRNMSTYRSDSEISRVNALAAKEPVHIDPELATLVERAQHISVLSGGAFDITYESVGYLYDFHTRKHPSEAEITERLPEIDYRHVHVDEAASTIRFDAAGVRINLGGIAKGYAVEHAAEMLKRAGVEHAVLNAGGDTRVIGDRLGKPWIIGIRHPRLADEVVTRLPIVDQAISTSGDYERFFEEDGRRYHHILNPATGEPAQGVVSATVIGPDATMTDGLSTTVFVLGPEKGLALIETLPDYEAVIVDSSGRLSYSSGLAPPAK
jgi:thiamine biosynthesis lipoprotein